MGKKKEEKKKVHTLEPSLTNRGPFLQGERKGKGEKEKEVSVSRFSRKRALATRKEKKGKREEGGGRKTPP